MLVPRLVIVLCAVVVGWSGAGVRAQEQVQPETHPGGILLVVTDKSGMVTNDSPLYLASNLVGWNPGVVAMKLSGRSDLRWQIVLPMPEQDSALQFKFTRGSWETCEVDADLADIDNRTLAPVAGDGLEPGKPVVIELVVERFADEREGAAVPQFRGDSTRPLDVTGRAFRLQVMGGAGSATGAMRDVVVWLPPGYDDEANAERRYPVLYMQDGQNVFESHPPTPGEWGADETATALIEAGEIEPIIIVGVPHSGGNRMLEYLPANAMDIEGQGDAYINWLLREVVPRVERVVRASRDPVDRGIGGSSLGGLVALRAAHRRPDIFGRVLAESPSLILQGKPLDLGRFINFDSRVFLGLGGQEYGEDGAEKTALLLREVNNLSELLVRQRGPGHEGEVRVEITPNAEHNEIAWAERLPVALRFLYPSAAE